MLRTIIVENEPHAAKLLQDLLTAWSTELRILAVFPNATEAIDGIRLENPDLVFLDVELDDDTTGFEVLEKFPNRTFEVIFTTGHHKYAVRAFHFSAMHYLEKPIDGLLLREALERVKTRRNENDFRLQLQVLSEAVRNLASLPQQVILPNPKEGDSIVVPVKDIIRVQARGSQAIFYFHWMGKLEKTMYSLNIGTLQKKMLQGYDDFIMIHESHIVNRNHITHYNSRTHTVQMVDGTYIAVAERRVSDFHQRFRKL